MEKTPQNNHYVRTPLFSVGAPHWAVKLIITGIALLLFQIPLYLIDDLSDERQGRNYAVQREISETWGGEQKIQVFPAEEERYRVHLASQIRYRGIYQFLVHQASVEINAVCQKLAKAQEAVVWVSDTDAVELCVIMVDGKPVPFKKEKSSFKFELPAGSSKYDVCMKVRGSGKFKCSSVSVKKSVINISGNWESPSFIGSKLPSVRSISSKGFSAEWIRQNPRVDEEIGVELCIPAGTYQQVQRCIKYSPFFLVVFFFSIIFAELFTKVRIHTFQYLVAACAPVLFYLMTLAFAEKVGFTAGYIISAAVVITMITIYARLFLNKLLPALILGTVIAAGYFLNYTIMRMEDNALLAGTIVFAVVLGVLMALTGKINQRQPKEDPKP